MPLATTPAYPEYSSGANSVTATTTGALEQLFHTQQLNLTLISTAVPNATRHYDTGSAVRADVVDARVWLGFHFRFADIASRNSDYSYPTGRSTTTSSPPTTTDWKKRDPVPAHHVRRTGSRCQLGGVRRGDAGSSTFRPCRSRPSQGLSSAWS